MPPNGRLGDRSFTALGVKDGSSVGAAVGCGVGVGARDGVPVAGMITVTGGSSGRQPTQAPCEDAASVPHCAHVEGRGEGDGEKGRSVHAWNVGTSEAGLVGGGVPPRKMFTATKNEAFWATHGDPWGPSCGGAH
jgi:hypothetical protein